MKGCLLFVGDTYLPEVYQVDLGCDCEFVINLEAPITKKSSVPTPGKINLACSDNNIQNAFGRLPIAVCLANNHIMDYGDEGFDDTIHSLTQKKIQFFGAGTVADNFNNPLIICHNGIKIAFLGYCYLKHIREIEICGFRNSPAPLIYENIARDVREYRDMVDRIAINLHWGVEERNIPLPEQVIHARKLIDIGADCIIGHHSHAIQPIEIYRDRLIAYGLGNFIFSDICAPSNYDREGRPSAHYRKKQRKWNKSSIGLCVDFEKMQYEVKNYFFNGETVQEKANQYHKYAKFKIPTNLKKLSRLNKWHERKNRIRFAIYRYFDNPKIPKLMSIIKLLKLIFTKR